MAVKLTKNELKNQKEALKMYKRYLPTLQLKKQQLQTEIRDIENRVKQLREKKDSMNKEFEKWVAIFGESGFFHDRLLKVEKVHTSTGNIAGVTIPVFSGADFVYGRYELYSYPLWVDKAVKKVEEVMLVDLEAGVLEEQVKLLSSELRTTTQRVNLFEKVKIPETRGNIKRISVYLGDQQVAAVVRGKISKKSLQRVAEKGENE